MKSEIHDSSEVFAAVAVLVAPLIANKIKQHKPHKCYPCSSKITTNWTLYWNPKEEIAQLRKYGLFIAEIIGSISAGLPVLSQKSLFGGRVRAHFPNSGWQSSLQRLLTSSFRMTRNLGSIVTGWCILTWYVVFDTPIVAVLLSSSEVFSLFLLPGDVY